MTTTKRRIFLKGTLASSVLGVAVEIGLLTPRMVLAAWPKSAFSAKSINDVLRSLFDTNRISNGGNIKIKAPAVVKDGAVVPITISTSLNNVESITILVEKNPTPLVAKFNLANNAVGFVSTHIKMAKSSKLLAVVQSGDRIFTATKKIEVAIADCNA